MYENDAEVRNDLFQEIVLQLWKSFPTFRGEAKITIGEETYHVKTGDAVFIPAGAVHSYENIGEEPFEFLCIIPNKEDKITILEESS